MQNLRSLIFGMRKKVYTAILVAGLSAFLSLLDMGNTDKYDPLLVQAINLNSFEAGYEFEYQNKYDGNHAIVLAAEIPVPIGQDYDTVGLEADITLVSTSAKRLSKSVNGHLYPFWGNNYSGIGLVQYVVPIDLPKEEQVVMSIVFNEESREILERYQFTKLLVLKQSDK